MGQGLSRPAGRPLVTGRRAASTVLQGAHPQALCAHLASTSTAVVGVVRTQGCALTVYTAAPAQSVRPLAPPGAPRWLPPAAACAGARSFSTRVHSSHAQPPAQPVGDGTAASLRVVADALAARQLLYDMRLNGHCYARTDPLALYRAPGDLCPVIPAALAAMGYYRVSRYPRGAAAPRPPSPSERALLESAGLLRLLERPETPVYLGVALLPALGKAWWTAGEVFEIARRAYTGRASLAAAHVPDSAQQQALRERCEGEAYLAVLSQRYHYVSLSAPNTARPWLAAFPPGAVRSEAAVRRALAAMLPPPPRAEDRVALLRDVVAAEELEAALAGAFPAAKRFSLEGAAAIVPLLRTVLRAAAGAGTDTVCLGMAHRGRLNVLANVLGREREVLAQFAQGGASAQTGASSQSSGAGAGAGGGGGGVLGIGDVKYHLGTEATVRVAPIRPVDASAYNAAAREDEDHQQQHHHQHHPLPSAAAPTLPVTVCVLPNPSHLEAVDPVAMGHARARQHFHTAAAPAAEADGECSAAADEGASVAAQLRVLGVLVHGDGSFAGQGVVQETLELGALQHYSTRGLLHVVLNNQVAFTTAPHRGRTSLHPSDAAKGVGLPVFYVSGEDLEAVRRVVVQAIDFRRVFGRSVVVELICYRARGHNEQDDPRFTQPQMCAAIAARAPLSEVHARRLDADGVDVAAIVAQQDAAADAAAAAAAAQAALAAVPATTVAAAVPLDTYHYDHYHNDALATAAAAAAAAAAEDAPLDALRAATRARFAGMLASAGEAAYSPLDWLAHHWQRDAVELAAAAGAHPRTPSAAAAAALLSRPLTGLSRARLRVLGSLLTQAPAGFALYEGEAAVLQQRRAMLLDESRPVDWACAEMLALAAAARAGVHVRLSGQDVGRGTFSQRHAVLVDQHDEREYTPLAAVAAHALLVQQRRRAGSAAAAAASVFEPALDEGEDADVYDQHCAQPARALRDAPDAHGNAAPVALALAISTAERRAHHRGGASASSSSSTSADTAEDTPAPQHSLFPTVANSSLSEAAVLGFEYGFALDRGSLAGADGGAGARRLVLWEAQFGDFANGAQTVIDTFIATGEAKWRATAPALVLLLPHGLEGQGPDHSSARPERFLALVDEDGDYVPGAGPAQVREARLGFESFAEGRPWLDRDGVRRALARLRRRAALPVHLAAGADANSSSSSSSTAAAAAASDDADEALAPEADADALLSEVGESVEPAEHGGASRVVSRASWGRYMAAVRRHSALASVQLTIACPSTPANYFHLLRRQTAAPRKPLVVFTPKWLLRHRHCASRLAEFEPGSRFQPVITDVAGCIVHEAERLPTATHRLFGAAAAASSASVSPAAAAATATAATSPPSSRVRRVLFCTGKVYYLLKQRRAAAGLDADVALVRLEQLCPFPFAEVAAVTRRYPAAELLWVQEEPKSQGWWGFVQKRIHTAIKAEAALTASAAASVDQSQFEDAKPFAHSDRYVRYVGRPAAAASAQGTPQQHQWEEQRLLREALDLPPQ